MKNIVLTSMVMGSSLLAQQNNNSMKTENNPFGLVYQGAITKNEKGKVNIHPVSYTTNGVEISANVYTPANYSKDKKYPAIVVAHPNGGVKEQVAGLYAQYLAEQGYITITADAAYQGASGGLPRNTDKPFNRINDIHAMTDYIETFIGVDVDNIGALGICGGGGYTLATAQSDKRLKSVATISMFNTGEVRRNGFLNSQLETIQERLKQASEARTKATKGDFAYMGDVPNLSKEDVAKIPTDLYREGYEYYKMTHAHPNSTFRYTTESLLDLMTFDVKDRMELINQPLLMIMGEKADSGYMTEEAFAKATGTADKELFKVENATHIQTYWKPEYVEQISDKLKVFFGRTLK